MKYLTTAAILSATVCALPAIDNTDSDAPLRRVDLFKRALDSSKPVPVTGEHAYHPADFAAGDIRGPCPGLNALVSLHEA
jgi:hypothetical protein